MAVIMAKAICGNSVLIYSCNRAAKLMDYRGFTTVCTYFAAKFAKEPRGKEIYTYRKPG